MYLEICCETCSENDSEICELCNEEKFDNPESSYPRWRQFEYLDD